jgi:AcrR family transcriptional regulator
MKQRRSDRATLVRVARQLFVQLGVRHASIEKVATAANIAKGTVYLAFDSKEALLRAVVEDVCSEVLQRSNAAGESMTDGWEKAQARLHAKYGWLHGWLNTSPFASELLAGSTSVAGDVVLKMDQAFAEQLTVDLRRADLHLPKGMTPAVLARHLMRLARACSLADEGQPPPDDATFSKRLNALLELVAAGLK